MTTFAEELEGGELALCPGKGGIFEIHADGARTTACFLQGLATKHPLAIHPPRLPSIDHLIATFTKPSGRVPAALSIPPGWATCQTPTFSLVDESSVSLGL